MTFDDSFSNYYDQEDGIPELVLDLGSWNLKAGFCGDDSVHETVYSKIGLPLLETSATTAVSKASLSDYKSSKYWLVGDQCLEECAPSTHVFDVLDNGCVRNWDLFGSLLKHTCYKHLRVRPEAQGTVVCDHLMAPKVNRQKMAELMFEDMWMPSLLFLKQPLAALMSGGRLNGLVVSSGHSHTETVPIIDGTPLTHAVNRSHVSGKSLSMHLAHLLQMKQPSAKSEMQLDGIKRKICNGEDVGLKDSFRLGDILFEPSLMRKKPVGATAIGIDKMAFDSMQKLDESNVSDMASNICLYGGSTMVRGIQERLQQNLRDLFCTAAAVSPLVKVIAAPERVSSTWIGASIVGSLADSRNFEMRLTLDQWQECGPSVINRFFP